MDKKKIINDAIFEEAYKDRVYDVVINILNLLASSKEDSKVGKILLFHEPIFSTLIFRLAEAYKYWYVKKEIHLLDNDLYFKFSNVVMYESSHWPMTVEEKDANKTIIDIFIKSGIIKKRIIDISDEKSATFYAVDFFRIFNYLMYLHDNSRNLNPKNKYLKQKLLDGSIT